MGSGCWEEQSFNASVTKCGFKSIDDVARSSIQDVFKSRHMASELNPYDVIRECCDSEEHPNTMPVMLCCDTTGSMGIYAKQCLMELNKIITSLYANFKDIQIMTMGIGDLYCDDAPLQVSQFESDERISDQLFKIWLEGGGGGNNWESYPLAWYFGLHATKLDCWNRGKKGIIITMGDEECPPALNLNDLFRTMGCTVVDQTNVDVKKLYAEASKKFDIYHISIKEGYHYRNYGDEVDASWQKMIGQHYFVSSADDLSNTIIKIITNANTDTTNSSLNIDEGGIYW